MAEPVKSKAFVALSVSAVAIAPVNGIALNTLGCLISAICLKSLPTVISPLPSAPSNKTLSAVSYTHLTLPTNREV